MKKFLNLVASSMEEYRELMKECRKLMGVYENAEIRGK